MCRRSKSGLACSYAGFIRRFPATIWLWILLPIPLLLLGRGFHSYANQDIESQQSIRSMVKAFDQWCQSDPCTLPNSCQLTVQWLENAHQHRDGVSTSSIGCIGLCNSRSSCNKSSLCMKTCLSKWKTASTFINYCMSGSTLVLYFIFGSTTAIFWVIFCIGSFCEYKDYIRQLDEDDRLKCV
jgi:hypothetical protein